MCALESRALRSYPLRQEILRQIEECSGMVEFRSLFDNGTIPSGRKRNQLVRESTGQYFCFLDDDDFISPDYVQLLCDGCDGYVQVVSLEMLRIDIDHGNARSHTFSIYHEDKKALSRGRWEMTANHLCAWRRDIGTKVAFPDHLGYADDVFWYRPLMESGLVTSEHHIDRTIYFYLWGGAASVNQQPQLRQATAKWQGGGIECFRKGSEIFIATECIEKSGNEAAVECRDKTGRVVTLDRRTLNRFSVVKVSV